MCVCSTCVVGCALNTDNVIVDRGIKRQRKTAEWKSKVAQTRENNVNARNQSYEA